MIRLDYPTPKRWEDLEDLCLAVWTAKLPTWTIQKNGRSGQAQNGVDIIAASSGRTIGIQCKCINRRQTQIQLIDSVKNAVIEAEGFQPQLTKLVVVMTVDRDSTLQAEVRKLSHERQANGLFEIEICSWDDLLDGLAQFPHIRDAMFAENGIISPKLSCDFETQSIRKGRKGIDWNFTLQNRHRFDEISISDLVVTLLYMHQKKLFMMVESHRLPEISLDSLQVSGNNLLYRPGHYYNIILRPGEIEPFTVQISLDFPGDWVAALGMWLRVSHDGNPARPSDVVVVLDKTWGSTGVCKFGESEVRAALESKEEFEFEPQFTFRKPGMYEMCDGIPCDWRSLFKNCDEFFRMKYWGETGR